MKTKTSGTWSTDHLNQNHVSEDIKKIITRIGHTNLHFKNQYPQMIALLLWVQRRKVNSGLQEPVSKVVTDGLWSDCIDNGTF